MVAKFNENQLKHIKLGERVAIRIEAIKQRVFHGEVVNIAPFARGGTGRRNSLLSLFALIEPPKTVPVKIAFDSDSVLGFAEQIDPGLETFVEVEAR